MISWSFLNNSVMFLYSSNICKILLCNWQLFFLTHELIYVVQAAHHQGTNYWETGLHVYETRCILIWISLRFAKRSINTKSELVLSNGMVQNRWESIIWNIVGLICQLASSYMCVSRLQYVNTSRPRQNSRHFADNIFKCIFVNENCHHLTTISLRFVLKGYLNNGPAFIQIMAWNPTGDEPLPGPIMV